MKITIHPVGVEVSEGLDTYIRERLNKFFSKQTYITGIDVYVKKQKEKVVDECLIETIMRLPGPEIFAEGEGKTNDIALNEAIEKMRRQLEKYKEKFHSHRPA
jgi:putative sigma-54 modulation protein